MRLAGPPRDPTHRHLELDLEIGSEPITGYLADESGRRSFTGWIDLVATIATACQPARLDASVPRTSTQRTE
jgi:hypothetical protein